VLLYKSSSDFHSLYGNI